MENEIVQEKSIQIKKIRKRPDKKVKIQKINKKNKKKGSHCTSFIDCYFKKFR